MSSPVPGISIRSTGVRSGSRTTSTWRPSTGRWRAQLARELDGPVEVTVSLPLTIEARRLRRVSERSPRASERSASPTRPGRRHGACRKRARESGLVVMPPSVPRRRPRRSGGRCRRTLQSGPCVPRTARRERLAVAGGPRAGGRSPAPVGDARHHLGRDLPRERVGGRARAVPPRRLTGSRRDPRGGGEPHRAHEHQLGRGVGHGRRRLGPDRSPARARGRRPHAGRRAPGPRPFSQLFGIRAVAAPRRGGRWRFHGHRVRGGVGPRRRRAAGRALGWVITGQSLSLVAGVPLVTLLGAVGGWRVAIGSQAARRSSARPPSGSRSRRAAVSQRQRVDPAEPPRRGRIRGRRTTPGEHHGADLLRGDGGLPGDVPAHDLRSRDARARAGARSGGPGKSGGQPRRRLAGRPVRRGRSCSS